MTRRSWQEDVDTGSLVVLLGLLLLVLGLSLMRKGSAGAEAEPPDLEGESSEDDIP